MAHGRVIGEAASADRRGGTCAGAVAVIVITDAHDAAVSPGAESHVQPLTGIMIPVVCVGRAAAAAIAEGQLATISFRHSEAHPAPRLHPPLPVLLPPPSLGVASQSQSILERRQPLELRQGMLHALWCMLPAQARIAGSVTALALSTDGSTYVGTARTHTVSRLRPTAPLSCARRSLFAATRDGCIDVWKPVRPQASFQPLDPATLTLMCAHPTHSLTNMNTRALTRARSHTDADAPTHPPTICAAHHLQTRTHASSHTRTHALAHTCSHTRTHSRTRSRTHNR
jgi:hypothetical protein